MSQTQNDDVDNARNVGDTDSACSCDVDHDFLDTDVCPFAGKCIDEQVIK